MPATSVYFDECIQNYKRMQLKDIDDEGVICLLEYIHSKINKEMESLADNSALYPNDQEYKRRIEEMERLLSSKYYDSISLGRGDEVLKKFKKMVQDAKKTKKRQIDNKNPINKKIAEVHYRFSGAPENVRKKMIYWRKSNGIDIQKMSNKTGISQQLLKMVEGGCVTHPVIAKKIQKAYELTDEETMYLVPEIHREGSETYNPDKYKVPEDVYMKLPAAKKNELVDVYLNEKKNKVRYRNWK